MPLQKYKIFLIVITSHKREKLIILFSSPQKEWPLSLLSEIYAPPISPVL